MSIKRFQFNIPDVSCAACTSPLEEAFKTTKLLKVKMVDASHVTKILSIDVEIGNLSEKEVKRQIVRIAERMGQSCEDIIIPVEKPSFWRSHWFLGAIGTIAGLSLILLSIFVPVLPLGAMIAIAVGSTILTLILGAPSYYSAFKKLVSSGTLTMDALFTISTLTVLAVSIASFFVPGLSMMFEAALLIYGFRHIGLAIEDSIKSKINEELDFQDRLPAKVKTGDVKDPWKKLSELRVGDIVYLEIDEQNRDKKIIIPVDGEALNDVYVDDSIKTGAVLPRFIKKGEPVIAGMYLDKRSPHFAFKLKPVSMIIEPGEFIPVNSVCLEGQGFIDEKIEKKAVKKGDVLVKEQLLSVDSSPITVEIKNEQTTVVIKPGELIPANCLCLDGDGFLDERIEKQAIKKGGKLKEGDTLSSDSSPLRIEIKEDLASFSYLARLDKRVVNARRKKAPIEETTSKILQYFIPAVIIVAITAAIVISFFFPPFLAIKAMVAILVSACPCILGLITALAIKVGFLKADHNGIHFKNDEGIEAAANTSHVLLDLNGTLTLGEPQVSTAGVIGEENIEDLLAHVGLLETNSEHPYAVAIKAFIKDRGLRVDTDQPIEFSEEKYHSGIKAKINGNEFVLGNRTMMAEHEINIAALNHLNLKGDESVVYLARNNLLIGYIIMRDPLREGAVETVKALTDSGKKVHICTGADIETAMRYAALLNIPSDLVHAGCVSFSDNKEDRSKTAYLEGLQKTGAKVAMIGDGANDTPTLALADFSVAIQSKSADEMAQAYADAYIDKEALQRVGLRPVANLFKVATQTISNIKQNLVVTLSYNLAVMVLSGALLILLGFVMNPAIGVALMMAQACLVLLNIYRLQKQDLDFKIVPAEENLLSAANEDSHVKMQGLMPGLQLKEQVDSTSGNVHSLWNKEEISLQEKPVAVIENKM